MKTLRKNIESGIAFGLIMAVLLSFSRFDAACEDIKENVLRLHIIANSDTKQDQNLKLKVRDAVLEYADKNYGSFDSLETAEKEIRKDLKEINGIAEGVIKENGFDYKVSTEIKDSYFETREYDTFTLPAGVYESLLIKIGKAEGKNWWCVVFPAVCIPAADDNSLSKSVPSGGVKIATDAQNYVIRFKIVEWYETFKRKFSKNL